MENGLDMAKTKYIETPEKMWEYFCLYREELKANPIKIIEQRKASINFKIYGEADLSEIGEEIKEAANPIVELPTQRPLTLDGFENWCADNDIIEDLGDYFSNKNNSYSEYSTICSRIRRVIRQDQIEGGMVGIYNPSITQRLNNLIDKTDITSKGEKIESGPSKITVDIIAPTDE